MQNLYWFITISRRADSDTVSELYQELEVPRLYSSLAYGTAKSTLLDLLGLEQCEKVIHQTVVTHNKLHELIAALERRLQIDMPGQGIALAVPLASISNKKTLDFFSGGHAEDEMTEQKQMNPRAMELIIAICNKGHTEDVMEVARAAGAGGGTVIHSRGISSEEAAGVWGLNAQEEKDLVLIIADVDDKVNIMKKISETCGVTSKANGTVISLPIDAVMGI